MINTKGEKAEGNTNSIPSSRSIKVSQETWYELNTIKLKGNWRSLDDLISAMLGEFRK